MLLYNKKERGILRFLISGTTGALVHFLILIFSKEILDLSIILSTTLAFSLASVVSFLLQKIWVFKNYDKGSAISHQAFRYLLVTILNVGINAILMHILVNIFGIYYIISQIVTSGLIAIESYILYKSLVFSNNLKES